MPVLAVMTSGGDAPGMNAAIVAITKTAIASGWRVQGVEDGYNGLIDGQFVELTPSVVDDLAREGGTFLRSARSKRFMTKEGRAQAARQLEGVEVLVVIGGNGSLTGALILSQEHNIRVVGVPASIDNDLACTSTSIGVDTALNTIVEACDRISDTARSHRRAFIVEVMGRECGYLAMASSIACSAEAVLFREQGKTESQLISELRQVIRRSYSASRNKKRVLIIKAEGVEVSTASLAAKLEETMQEDAGGATLRYTILGHVVRGGRPSYSDRLIGSRLGYAAAWAAMNGESQKMVGWRADEEGGQKTDDPRVQLFELPFVLSETTRLLDGTHPTTKARLKMISAVQGVLPL
ncbi:MAG: 6-phosphofructokinase [Myxococcota bacterium]